MAKRSETPPTDPRDELPDLEVMLDNCAALPLASETPGVARDDLVDQWIMIARRIVSRDQELKDLQRQADVVDGYNRDDLGESPDY